MLKSYLFIQVTEGTDLQLAKKLGTGGYYADELGKCLGRAIESSHALAPCGFQNSRHGGDGHVTILYGHMPVLGFSTTSWKNTQPAAACLARIRAAARHEVATIRDVQRGHNGCSIVALLDAPVLQPLVDALYKEALFCRGHPSYTGPWKLDDPLWGKRSLHVTLANDLDLSRLDGVPGIFRKLVGQEVRFTPCIDERIVLVDNGNTYRYYSGIWDGDDEGWDPETPFPPTSDVVVDK